MSANGDEPLLSARNVVQEFVVRGHGGVKGGVVQAVSDVSFDVRAGETLGVVGETGSGKSTLARSVLQAPRPKSGSVRFQGNDLVGLKGRRLLEARRSLQMVFQDPFGSLDPKWRVSDLVEEPLVAYGVGTREERRRRVREVLDTVGLDPDVYGRRRPRQLSGGQAQRVAIARALTLDPALIICDEAVSSLDVLIQAQVLNLFERLRAELGLSYLFIAHDLALVKQVSDRVAVDVPRAPVRARPGRGALPRALPPLHGGAAGLDPQPRPRRAAGGRRTRRSAAIRPRRSTRPAAAASARAARARRSAARPRCPRCASSPPTTPSPATSRSSATAPGRRDGDAPGLPHRRPGDPEPAPRRASRPAGRARARAGRLRPRDVGLLARAARRRRRDPRRRRPGRAAADHARRARRRAGRAPALRRLHVQPARDVDGDLHDLGHVGAQAQARRLLARLAADDRPAAPQPGPAAGRDLHAPRAGRRPARPVGRRRGGAPARQHPGAGRDVGHAHQGAGDRRAAPRRHRRRGVLHRPPLRGRGRDGRRPLRLRAARRDVLRRAGRRDRRHARHHRASASASSRSSTATA